MGHPPSAPTGEEEPDFHRKEARRCFNHATDYLGKKVRSSQEDCAMLHLAHASRYHWGVVGGAREVASADFLSNSFVSRGPSRSKVKRMYFPCPRPLLLFAGNACRSFRHVAHSWIPSSEFASVVSP